MSTTNTTSDQKANPSSDIGSIFFKKGKGKAGAQKKTGGPTTTAPNQTQSNPQKEKEENKNAAASKTTTQQQQNDYESDDDETNNARLDIGSGQVMDIKQVNKQKQEELNAQKGKGLNLDQIFQGDSNEQSKPAAQTSDKKNQDKGFQKGTHNKDGISFAGAKPQFGRSKNMGNKMEFPELDQPSSNKGQNASANQSGTKSEVGGPIGQMSSTASTGAGKPKGEYIKQERPERQERTEQPNEDYSGFRTQKRQEQPKIEEEEESKEEKKEPVKPKFTGGAFKKLLQSQNEENKDKNVGLEAYQQKLAAEIKIHAPKPPPRVLDKDGNPVKQDADDEFDHKVEENKRGGDHHRGGERGRGGRGRGDGEYRGRGERGERGGFRGSRGGRGRGTEGGDNNEEHHHAEKEEGEEQTFQRGERQPQREPRGDRDQEEKKPYKPREQNDKQPRKDKPYNKEGGEKKSKKVQSGEHKKEEKEVKVQEKPVIHPSADLQKEAQDWNAFKF